MSRAELVHSVNQSVLSLIHHEIKNGQWNRCRDLGFPDKALAKFQELTPEHLVRLSFSTVPWISVHIDEQLFWRVAQTDIEDDSEDEIQRAIRLGATSFLMMNVFGITHSETAERRRLLQIGSKRGRLRDIPDDQKNLIWTRWMELTQGISPTDDLQALRIMMDIAEETGIVLSHIWTEIKIQGRGRSVLKP